ncbi:hypothetical protein [Noviherbaspirillum galbum]|uniref:Uncharacterized protein n=1 Tax=Noviherbaspirillum galbum TaxID=2709383 RepID=A0A6B3SIK2_9BURK|nr:hypothetical protein [Noviherbaspirillum galbum]NEX60523.1 hypothetical protein [Noviherbaspirillum galbum]
MPGPLGDPLDPLPSVPEPGEVGLVPTPRPEEVRPVPLVPLVLPGMPDAPAVPAPPVAFVAPVVPAVPEALAPFVPEPLVEPTGAQSRLPIPADAVVPLALPMLPIDPEEAPDMPLVPVGPLTMPAGQSELAPDAEVPCVLEVPDALEPVPPPVAALLLEPLGAAAAGVVGSTLLPVPRVAELMPEVLGAVLCAMAMPAQPSSAASNVMLACVFMRFSRNETKACDVARSMPSSQS